MFLAVVVGLTLVTMTSCQDDDETISFFVGLKNKIVPGDTVVPFDLIIMNEAYGYDTDTNAFIAPRDGIYMFHIGAQSETGNLISTNLYKNDEYVITMLACQNTDFDTSATSIALSLFKGDNIYLKTTSNISTFSGKDNEMHATFVGYRLEV